MEREVLEATQSLKTQEHVGRVADMVPQDCWRVALMHDAVEDGPYTLAQLRANSALTHDEVKAIDLLTRRERDTYDIYITLILNANGPAGDMARTVKEADLIDNITRCLRTLDSPKSQSLLKRYRRALGRFYSARARQVSP